MLDMDTESLQMQSNHIKPDYTKRTNSQPTYHKILQQQQQRQEGSLVSAKVKVKCLQVQWPKQFFAFNIQAEGVASEGWTYTCFQQEMLQLKGVGM